jgi:hypothetical protein
MTRIDRISTGRGADSRIVLIRLLALSACGASTAAAEQQHKPTVTLTAAPTTSTLASRRRSHGPRRRRPFQPVVAGQARAVSSSESVTPTAVAATYTSRAWGTYGGGGTDVDVGDGQRGKQFSKTS